MGTPAQTGYIEAPVSSPGSFTVGAYLACYNVAKQSTGIRFYWESAGGARTIRCRIWNNAGGLLGSVDVAVNASGIYQGNWGAPVTLPNGRVIYGIWETTGGTYTRSPAIVALSSRYQVFPGIVFDTNAFRAGDGVPNTGTGAENYPTDLIMAP